MLLKHYQAHMLFALPQPQLEIISNTVLVFYFEMLKCVHKEFFLNEQEKE